MVESIIHRKLKIEVKNLFGKRYTYQEEFKIHGRRIDIAIFKGNTLYALVECKNNQARIDLVRKFKYLKDMGEKCNFIIFSSKSNGLIDYINYFNKDGIIYLESNIKKDDWRRNKL